MHHIVSFERVDLPSYSIGLLIALEYESTVKVNETTMRIDLFTMFIT